MTPLPNPRLESDALMRAAQAQRWLGRFAPSHRRCRLPSAFVLALRASPSSGCSGQPSPRASSRVRQPLIRSAVSLRIMLKEEQCP